MDKLYLKPSQRQVYKTEQMIIQSNDATKNHDLEKMKMKHHFKDTFSNLDDFIQPDPYLTRKYFKRIKKYKSLYVHLNS